MEKNEVFEFIKKLYEDEMGDSATPEQIEQFATNFTEEVIKDDVALNMVESASSNNATITISDLKYAVDVE